MRTAITPLTLLRHVYESATEFAIITIDLQGLVSSWSAGAVEILGFSEQEMVGADPFKMFTEEDRASGEAIRQMMTAVATGKAADYRWHLRKSGERFWADGVMTPIRSDTNEVIGYLKILKDITERKLAQDKIASLSTTDTLTGLANRSAFDDRIREAIALCARSGEALHLMVIDLDLFKEVNDTLGHPAGDILLQHVASRLRLVCRESDYIARLGGDEFGLLQTGRSDPSASGVLAVKILEAIAQPFQLGGSVVRISASIGIASTDHTAIDPSVLMKQADLALYKAKQAGRNSFQHFTDELDRIAHKRNLDSDALRKAVIDRNFVLAYQPIINCHSGQATAMEALIRFPSSELSGYTVDYLIDLARDVGLIFDIGAWVFEEACLQLMRWRNMGFANLKICINTCAKELLNEHYVASIRGALALSGIDAGDVNIELTERDAIDLNNEGSSVLQYLVSAGFRLSLDDFGTGYSSLSYLRMLPVATLKLDRSFLRGVPSEATANAVAKAIIALAQELNLQVVAEGVEDLAQAQFLHGLDCSALQGFLFSRALPASEATTWLIANRAQEEARQQKPVK
jgi:diguanylate cyclase (GGDEF)-like protein/PAS domain S-box-containing protein